MVSGFFISGNPATLVSKDGTPAKPDALATINQPTSPITTAVPMVAPLPFVQPF